MEARAASSLCPAIEGRPATTNYMIYAHLSSLSHECMLMRVKSCIIHTYVAESLPPGAWPPWLRDDNDVNAESQCYYLLGKSGQEPQILCHLNEKYWISVSSLFFFLHSVHMPEPAEDEEYE